MSDSVRIAKVKQIIDHGFIRTQGIARYAQVFEDGTVVFSDTLPDRNAWKVWVQNPASDS